MFENVFHPKIVSTQQKTGLARFLKNNWLAFIVIGGAIGAFVNFLQIWLLAMLYGNGKITLLVNNTGEGWPEIALAITFIFCTLAFFMNYLKKEVEKT